MNEKQLPDSFYRDDKDIFLRSLYYATLTVYDIYAKYENATKAYMIRERMDNRWERSAFNEIIGYATSFALKKLVVDIKAVDGWSNETWDLFMTYYTMIARAYEEVFQIPNAETRFWKILDAYNDGNQFIGLEIDEQWEIHGKDGTFQPENVYAYRISLLTKKSFDKDAAARIVRDRYSVEGLPHYEVAFLEKELSIVRNNLIALRQSDLPELFSVSQE